MFGKYVLLKNCFTLPIAGVLPAGGRVDTLQIAEALRGHTNGSIAAKGAGDNPAYPTDTPTSKGAKSIGTWGKTRKTFDRIQVRSERNSRKQEWLTCRGLETHTSLHQPRGFVVLLKQLRTCNPCEPGGVAFFFRRGPQERRNRARAEKTARIRLEKRMEEKQKQRKGAIIQEQNRRHKRKEKVLIATWNVQAMNISERRQRKLKALVRHAENRNWSAVLVTDMTARDEAYLIMDGWTLVHGKKTGVLLCPEWASRWKEAGRSADHTDRTTTVLLDELALVAFYAPTMARHDRIERHLFWDSMEAVIGQIPGRNVIVAGGDMNAQIGRGDPISGVVGEHGMEWDTPTGVELRRWLIFNGLCHWNSFFCQNRRGTWLRRTSNAWYELDGFIGRQSQRNCVKSVRTVGLQLATPGTDHLPKVAQVVLKRQRKKWLPKPKRVMIEKLQGNPRDRDFQERTTQFREAMQESMMAEQPSSWTEMASVVTKVAETSLGVKTREADEPWLVRHEEEISRLAGERRILLNIMRGQTGEDCQITKRQLRAASQEMKRKMKRWEQEYWDEILDETVEASRTNDQGKVYRLLRRLGTRSAKESGNRSVLFSPEECKAHFEKVGADRGALTEAVNGVEMEWHPEWATWLDRIPDDDEINKAINETKNKAAGLDDVRIEYIKYGGGEVQTLVRKIVREMWTTPSDAWEDVVKVGVQCSLYKGKGDRNSLDNYRGVVLLSMLTRIMARIAASRLSKWAEDTGQLSETQYGFRRGRGTEDAIHVIRRVYEEAEERAHEVQTQDKPMAGLMDLRKAYPTTQRDTMWELLRRKGIAPNGNMMRTLKGMHEKTEYACRVGKELSERYRPRRGLREGCPSSPILFNILHDESIRHAIRTRKRNAEEHGLEGIGLEWKWRKKSRLTYQQQTKRNAHEAETTILDRVLFADDTTMLGKKRELQDCGGMDVSAQAMKDFGQTENEDKREWIVMGNPAQCVSLAPTWISKWTQISA